MLSFAPKSPDVIKNVILILKLNGLLGSHYLYLRTPAPDPDLYALIALQAGTPRTENPKVIVNLILPSQFFV